MIKLIWYRIWWEWCTSKNNVKPNWGYIELEGGEVQPQHDFLLLLFSSAIPKLSGTHKRDNYSHGFTDVIIKPTQHWVLVSHSSVTVFCHQACHHTQFYGWYSTVVCSTVRSFNSLSICKTGFVFLLNFFLLKMLSYCQVQPQLQLNLNLIWNWVSLSFSNQPPRDPINHQKVVWTKQRSAIKT